MDYKQAWERLRASLESQKTSLIEVENQVRGRDGLQRLHAAKEQINEMLEQMDKLCDDQ